MLAAPPFASEVAMLIMFLSGFGLPIGIPPEKENPVMSFVAPEECVIYASWAGMAAADPGSPNRTEQLLAEPEIREFAAALELAFGRSIAAAAAQTGDEQAALHAKAAPLWARTLVTRPATLFLTKLEPRGQSVNIEGGLILQAGDAASELNASLTQILSSEDRQPAEIMIGTRKFHKLVADEALPCDLVWGAGNGYLMIGLGPGAIEGMSARIRAQQEPAWLTVLRQELPIERRSTVSYVNIRKLVDTFAPLAGPQGEALLSSLGLRQIGALECSTGLDENGTLSLTTLTLDGPPRGLLAAISPQGIQPGDLAHIPSDALFATCFSLDAGAAYRGWLEALREADPRAASRFEEELRGLETELGASLPEIFAALGNNWSLHAASADGGLMSSALTVEVADRAKLAAVQDRVAAMLGRPNGPPMSLVRTDYAGQTIFHVRAPRGEMPFLPAWSLSGKHLVLGLNPQAVKAVLARQVGEKSLADLPPVAERLGAGQAAVGLTYYDTREFFESIYSSLQFVAPMMLGQMQRRGLPLDFDPAMLPAPRTIGKHLQPSVTVVRRTQRGLVTETRQTLPGLNVGASAPLAAALLLPAVQAANDAADRMRGSNNLKQQLLGMHNYHDTFGTFPSAYNSTADGKPLLSWRVAILPFIEQKPLYDQFRLDEPWDSEHNKALIAKMPEVFKAPGSKAGEGKTVYLAVGGKQGVIVAPIRRDGSFSGVGLRHVTDGTSNTFCIIEAGDESAVVWTKPEEWVPNEEMPLKGLVRPRMNGFQAALCDGSVRFISQTIDVDMMRRLLMRADGFPVEIPRDPRRR